MQIILYGWRQERRSKRHFSAHFKDIICFQSRSLETDSTQVQDNCSRNHFNSPLRLLVIPLSVSCLWPIFPSAASGSDPEPALSSWEEERGEVWENTLLLLLLVTSPSLHLLTITGLMETLLCDWLAGVCYTVQVDSLTWVPNQRWIIKLQVSKATKPVLMLQYNSASGENLENYLRLLRISSNLIYRRQQPLVESH